MEPVQRTAGDSETVGFFVLSRLSEFESLGAIYRLYVFVVRMKLVVDGLPIASRPIHRCVTSHVLYQFMLQSLLDSPVCREPVTTEVTCHSSMLISLVVFRAKYPRPESIHSLIRHLGVDRPGEEYPVVTRIRPDTKVAREHQLEFFIQPEHPWIPGLIAVALYSSRHVYRVWATDDTG